MESRNVNKCYSVYNVDLNIRRVDRESVRRLKQAALAEGISLRDLCIRKLGIRGEGEAEKKGPVKKIPERSALGSCASCGGLNGLHQRGCTR